MAVKKRNKALDGLAKLRASGATSATFHPDGSVASVVFAPAPSAEHVPALAGTVRLPTPAVEEALGRPYKTDVDSLDDLPAYEGEAN